MALGIILRAAVFMAVLCTAPVWADAGSGGSPRGLATDAIFQSINPSTAPGEPTAIKPPATAHEDGPGLFDAESNGLASDWEQKSSDSDRPKLAQGWDSEGGGHFIEYLAGAAALLAIFLIFVWHSTQPRAKRRAQSTRSRSRRKRRSSHSRARRANFETSRRD
jgi:hypothetical protein